MSNEQALAALLDLLSIAVWPIVTILSVYRIALSIDAASIAVTRYFNLRLEQLTSPSPPPVANHRHDNDEPVYYGSILD